MSINPLISPIIEPISIFEYTSVKESSLLLGSKKDSFASVKGLAIANIIIDISKTYLKENSFVRIGKRNGMIK